MKIPNCSIGTNILSYQISSLAIKSDYLTAAEKTVAILPPPPTTIPNAELQVKEALFQENLNELTLNDNVKILENPVESYSDYGHPSIEETQKLLQCIQSYADSLNVPFLLPSATIDTATSTLMYKRVNSLYKYGCAACNTKEQNEYYNLCNNCKNAIKEDKELKEKVVEYRRRLAEREDQINPPLATEEAEDDISDDELKCDDCEVTFTDMNNLRAHFRESHPGSEFKFKRGKAASHRDDERKGSARRRKGIPERSLPKQV